VKEELVERQAPSTFFPPFFLVSFFLGKKNELQHKNHHYGIMFSFPLLHFLGEKERVATQESSLWDHVFFPLVAL
jgi:hypothetical protein